MDSSLRCKLLAVALCASLPAAAQGAPVEVALTIGSERYEAKGPGECKSAPQAAIYGTRAEMHTASHRDDKRSVRLTLWKPRDGSPAMINLDVAEGSTRHAVDTVKGPRKETRGSGQARFEPSGQGGTFTIEAVSASGERIRGTIRCAAMGAVRAEGG